MSDFVRKSDVLDLLYGIFDKYKISTDKNTSIGKSFGTDVFEEIRNIPTAYSVDKVVEKLEELRKKDVCDYLYCDVCAYTDKCSGVTDQSNNLKWDKAIEIVKQDGVADDVCEWKYNDSEYYFESSCDHLHIFMSDGPKENGYRYCPYCGKKIKAVE